MTSIQLFLEGYEMELDNSISFPLNRQYEQLDDPTVIKNDWSNTVKIPFTLANNKIFGNIFDIERDVANYSEDEVAGPNIGLYFNPSKKIPFYLSFNGSIITNGYAKLNEVDVQNRTYNVTLYGQLGNTISELMKCTFNPSEEGLEEKYYLRNMLSDGLELNKTLVKQSWDNDTPQLSLDGCGDTDIIGFAPSYHGLNDEFDSKSYLRQGDSGVELRTFGDWLNKMKEIDYGDSIVGDGFNERQVGEYRSYYQKPYIYVNKLWQLMVATSESICEYPLVLDPGWFNANNPDYTDCVYILPNYDLKELREQAADAALTNTYKMAWEANKLLSFYPANGTGTKTLPLEAKSKTESYNLYTYPQTFNCYNSPSSFSATLNFRLRVWTNRSCNRWIIRPGTGVILYIKNGDYTYKVLVCSSEANINELKSKLYSTYGSFDKVVQIPEYATEESGDYYYWDFQVPYYGTSNKTSKMEVTFYCTSTSGGRFSGRHTGIIWNQYEGYCITILTPNQSTVTTRKVTSAHLPVSMEKLFANVDKPMNICLNHAKMFGLVFKIDHPNRRIYVTTRSKYFEDKEIIDWTDKVDTSGKFIIKQASFEKKYVDFNYESQSGDNYKTYETKYGMTMGTKRIVTAYDFNTDKKELFKKIKPFNMSSPFIASLSQYISWQPGSSIARYQPREIYIDDYDNNKSAKLYGCYAYRNPNLPRDTRIVTPYITDDTSYEMAYGVWCYNRHCFESNMVQVDNFPHISYLSTRNSSKKKGILFNLPTEVNCNKSVYSSMDTYKFIYDRYWRNYINERYTYRNKVITLKVALTPKDYWEFDFNKFVKINNTLCMVNKITNFNLATNNPTDVELITVRDIDNYTFGETYEFTQFKNSTGLRVISSPATVMTVSAASTRDVSVVSSVNWITVSPATMAGDGNQHSITIRVAENESGATRTGYVYLKSGNTTYATLGIRQMVKLQPIEAVPL